MDGSDRLVEIRRSSTKKPSTRPSGAYCLLDCVFVCSCGSLLLLCFAGPAVTGGSDGSPGHKHHTGDGEEASSGLLLLSDEPGPDEIILNENGRPSRASGRASKRALAHIAHQLLEDEDEDEEDDDVFEEDEGEGRLLPPKLPLKGRKDAPPGASPAVIVRAGGNGKQAPSKKAKAAPLRKPMLSLPPALSPNTAIPPPPSHQSSTSELAQESPMLPKRRWQATVCWPRHHPRHMTFGWRNPAVPDPLITNILSYLANDDVHNSSLVCNAWAALAMDCFLWDWDGVVGVTTLVPVVDPVSAAGGNQFESMFPLTPQRPGKGGYPGLPFMCDELPTGSSYLGSPLVSPTGGRYFGMLSSTPDRSVRLSHMSPLLCPSPERPLNPPANSGNVRRPEAPRR